MGQAALGRGVGGDDDPQAREAHRKLVELGLPNHPIRLVERGETALVAMAQEVPALVPLDLVMPAHTSALVKKALAYFHQNYAHPVSRWEIAEAVGVSEDYLTRVFHRELNISPWEYLTRYRILQSRHLLLNTAETVGPLHDRWDSKIRRTSAVYFTKSQECHRRPFGKHVE